MNIGTPGVNAAKELRGHPAFDALRAALADAAHDMMLRAIECPVEQRVEQTAYARAARDIWTALEAAATGTLPRAVKLPRPKTASTEGIL